MGKQQKYKATCLRETVWPWIAAGDIKEGKEGLVKHLKILRIDLRAEWGGRGSQLQLVAQIHVKRTKQGEVNKIHAADCKDTHAGRRLPKEMPARQDERAYDKNELS